MKMRSGLAATRTLRWQVVKLILAAGMAAALAAGPGGSAQAQMGGSAAGSGRTGAAWPAHPLAIPAALSAVSCIGSSFCVASGSYSKPGHVGIVLLERWNGRTWRIIPDPRGYAGGFTCGGPSFCLATASPPGSRAREVVWNGRTWQNLKQQPPTFGVICESPTFCVTTNGDPYEGRVVEWNGHTWQAMTDDSSMCGGPDCTFDSLGCDSASICFASGSYCTDGNCDSIASFYTTWNGSAWRDTTSGPPFPGSGTCARRSFCMVIALPAKAAISRNWGNSWHDASAGLAAACHAIADCGQPANLACGSSWSCLALVPPARPTAALAWNGATWRSARLARISGHLPKLAGLSCGSPTNCIAIGTYQLTPRSLPRPIAEHWNGTAWHLTRIANP